MSPVRTAALSQSVPFLKKQQPLDYERQLELVKKAKEGPTQEIRDQAKLQLFSSLKEMIIKEFYIRWKINYCLWRELFCVSYLGFEKALQHFDAEKNTKFSTYAYYQLRVTLSDWLITELPLKVPKDAYQILLDVKKALARSKKESYRRQLTNRDIEDCAQTIGKSPKIVRQLIICTKTENIDVINEYSLGEEEAPYEETLSSTNMSNPPEDPVATEVLRILKNEAIEHAIEVALDDREKRVIKTIFFLDDKTQIELANDMGFSRETIRRMKNQALEKMAAFLRQNYPQFCPRTD